MNFFLFSSSSFSLNFEIFLWKKKRKKVCHEILRLRRKFCAIHTMITLSMMLFRKKIIIIVVISFLHKHKHFAGDGGSSFWHESEAFEEKKQHKLIKALPSLRSFMKIQPFSGIVNKAAVSCTVDSLHEKPQNKMKKFWKQFQHIGWISSLCLRRL